MSYLPVIDEAACAAHGDCAIVAPDVFVIEDVAVVVADGPPDLVLAAAEACPSAAIEVVDRDTGTRVYP
jgi:ferredoxin